MAVPEESAKTLAIPGDTALGLIAVEPADEKAKPLSEQRDVADLDVDAVAPPLLLER